MNTLWEALSGHLEEADELNEKVTAKLSAARGRLSSAVRRKSAAPPAVRFIERSYHYLTKPSARRLTLVTKLGHRAGSRKLKA